MIEDKTTEELKKTTQDLGLIVNAGADEQQDTTDAQTKVTRQLPVGFKQNAEEEMAGEREGDKN
jgi:hypothetical protein